ncbi:VanZ family protein [bacterium]|nr:VanZ family protein [bacterium]
MFLDNGRNIERVRAVLVIYLIVMTIALLIPNDWLPDWLRGQESMLSGFGAKDKILHTGSFAALSFLGIRSLRGSAFGRRAVIMLGVALCYGAITEIVQGASGFRDYETLDLIADMVGAGIGVGIAWLLDRRKPVSTSPVDSFTDGEEARFPVPTTGSPR